MEVVFTEKEAQLNKTFCFPIESKPLAVGYGACIVSDRITVEGYPVRFMYRTEPEPDYPIDSGWCFLSCFEDDEYMDDASNHGIYDINTIANLDPTIVPLLGYPIGSVFEKTPESERWLEVKDWQPRDD
jgi:hypothetical protein